MTAALPGRARRAPNRLLSVYARALLGIRTVPLRSEQETINAADQPVTPGGRRSPPRSKVGPPQSNRTRS